MNVSVLSLVGSLGVESIDIDGETVSIWKVIESEALLPNESSVDIVKV